MARTYYRPSQNLVIAAEGGPGKFPAHFRPSNQARLLRTSATNPSVADDADQLAGMNALSGNGLGDNGLSSAAAQRRFANHVDQMRLRHLAQLGATGDPNANPLPVTMSMSVDQAMRDLPAPPTGDRWQSFLVSRHPRDRFTSWEVQQHMSGNTNVFTAQLIRTMPDGTQAVLKSSDDLATQQDAQNYIQAHEFARNAMQGSSMPLGFNRRLMSTATPGGAAAAQSQMVPLANPASPMPGMYQPGGNVTNLTENEVQKLELDGMGAVRAATGRPRITLLGKKPAPAPVMKVVGWKPTPQPPPYQWNGKPANHAAETLQGALGNLGATIATSSLALGALAVGAAILIMRKKKRS